MATGRIPINGTAAIQQTLIDAKGDLIAGTGADAVSRLAVGANGTTLVADSAEATGLKWATPSSGGLVLITTLNPSSVIEAIADNVFTSTYKSYYIVGSLSVSGNTGLFAQLRSGGSNLTTNTYRSIFGATLISKWAFCENAGNQTLQMQFNQILTRPQEAAYKQGTFQFSKEGVAAVEGDWQEGTLTARDGIRYVLDSGTFTGKITIYGLAQ